MADPAETPEHNLEQMVAAIAAKGDFPAAGRMIQRLHDAVRRENCNALDVAQVILADPGLSSKVLRVVNSSFYRPRGEPVSTITRAVFLLGFEAIRDLATGLLLIEEIARAGGGHPAIRDVLHQCLLCGSVSRALSTVVGYPNPEEAYLLGLFANWGQLCLAAYYPERYERALHSAGVRASLERALGEEFGLASGDLATAMLERWNFPASYGEYFQQPPARRDRPVTASEQRLFALVDVANDLAACTIDPDGDGPAEAEAILHAAETMFGRRIEDVRVAVERGVEEAREHLPMLRSMAPKAPGPHRMTAAPRGAPDAAGSRSVDAHGVAVAASEQHEMSLVPSGRTAAAFEILAEITRAILSQDDINGTLAMVLEGVARTGGFERAFLALLNGRKDCIIGRLGYGDGVADYLKTLRVPLLPAGGMLAEAILAREPRIVGGDAALPMHEPVRELTPPALTGPSIAHPLIVRGKAVGVMVAARKLGEPGITSADATLVQLFCNQAGLALDRAVG